jgi:V8-like Glu-specific endopeptidase
MKKKKSKLRGTHSDVPQSQDSLALRDNRSGTGRMPKELQSLASSVSVVFATTDRKAKRSPSLQRVKVSPDLSAWRVTMEEGFYWGIPGTRLDKISPKKISRKVTTESTLTSHCPGWADFVYHPKLSSVRHLERLRRRSGARVIPHIVFGEDDRTVYYPEGYPWHCIGYVYSWTDPSSPSPQMKGTGALVGGNIVLTAGHLVPWDASPWMMLFTPGYYDGRSTLGSGVYSYVEKVRGYDTTRQAYDIAVLKLYEPLGEWLGYFGARLYYNDWEDGDYWTLCGYPGEIASGERPSYQTQISVIDDDGDGDALEIEHRGDASHGNSGSPFFGWWDPGPYVIGTHAGGQIEKYFPWGEGKINVAAGGEAFVNLVGWARDNW